ncbi:hypothetical protein KIPB_014444, partial [Kipferlia bialata]|eukprot:g14444.t1
MSETVPTVPAATAAIDALFTVKRTMGGEEHSCLVGVSKEASLVDLYTAAAKRFGFMFSMEFPKLCLNSARTRGTMTFFTPWNCAIPPLGEKGTVGYLCEEYKRRECANDLVIKFMDMTGDAEAGPVFTDDMQ